jgi:hypothetical protein
MHIGFRFFSAGIIQGSHQDLRIHNQDYHKEIRRILKKSIMNCHVFCPADEHPDSPYYDDRKAQHVFIKHLEKVKQSHCLIVYLPEASMGSAIEMWEAFHRKTITVTISPMKTNWVVRILSDLIFSNLKEFQKFVESGKLHRMLEERFPHVKES